MSEKPFVVSETGNAWQVCAEGDVYGLVCDTQAQALAWASALNAAYDAGIQAGRGEECENHREKLHVAFQREEFARQEIANIGEVVGIPEGMADAAVSERVRVTIRRLQEQRNVMEQRCIRREMERDRLGDLFTVTFDGQGILSWIDALDASPCGRLFIEQCNRALRAFAGAVREAQRINEVTMRDG